MFVCMCVWMREICLSVLGVSQKERKMLTKLCCDKWFISTTLNLKAGHISSFYLLRLQTSTVPSAKTMSTPCSFTHSVFLWPCSNPRPFQTLYGLSKVLNSSRPSVLLLSSTQKSGSLFIKCRRMLTSHFVGLRENLKQHSLGLCHFWSVCSNFFFFFFCNKGGLTCARRVMFHV